MKTTKSILLGAVALCLAAVTAKADGDPAATKGTGNLGANDVRAISTRNNNNNSSPVSSVPSSANNYLDDRLLWSTDISALSYPNADSSYCVPAMTTLIGRSSKLDTVAVKDSSGNSTNKTLQAVALDPWEDQVSKACARDDTGKPLLFGVDGKPLVDTDNGNKKYGKAFDSATKQYSKKVYVDDGVDNALPPGKLAYITSDVAASADSRKGFDFGALAVPFKVQMTGKEAFTTSASLGAYVGYRLPLLDTGLMFSPVIFAGASNISTQVTKGAKTTSQTDAGLSYGAGFITTVKDSIQVGLVVGFDHVDSAQPYAYNDKPWLSLEVGYSFAQ